MVLSAGFSEKKFNKIRYISLGPLCNLTFTNKLLVKGQNKKKIKPSKVFHTSFLLKIFTAKTADEDPVVCHPWIFRTEI